MEVLSRIAAHMDRFFAPSASLVSWSCLSFTWVLTVVAAHTEYTPQQYKTEVCFAVDAHPGHVNLVLVARQKRGDDAEQLEQ